jgi:hypothetical protein
MGRIPLTALAATTDIELTLAGGEVVGSPRGSGVASVEAKVRNNGSRALRGIRIGVWFSATDQAPPLDAQWRIREFVFEPPLKPGGVSTLRFSDEAGAEYVALLVRRAVFEAALSFGEGTALLHSGLSEREGAPFIAVRDLMELLGGKAGLDKGAGVVVLELGEESVRIKERSDIAISSAGTSQLEHALIEVEGRSYIELSDAARLLGLKLSYDNSVNLYAMTE